MHYPPARNICFLLMAILFSSILSCSKKEKEAHQEEQLVSKTEIPTQNLTNS